ncbi:type 4b pilus protein PilO2 [Pseudomonas aeruginosa]|uniref:type 4b pilus protein PilO2 n=1 Tax=Pseudomonas aeruginosa TaxID=287 RepID=UPI00053D0AC7|nr:type 4b pilus protein PilO2 [Pseudomonas aeruginosa]
MEKINARAIVRGKVAFLAGLHWEPQGVVQRRRLKSVARSKGADALVDYAYLDEKGKAHRVVGLARLKRLGLPSGTRAVYALGLLIADQLGRGGYAIVPLGGEVYALVGSIGGKLYRDVVGDRASVEQARQTFLSFNAEPEGGWQAFAPQEWGLENSRPFDLDGLLNARRFPAAARLRSASLRGPLVASVGVVAVLCAGYLGYAYHQDQQLKAQQEAQRLALLAQQAAEQAANQVVTPWTVAPRIAAFVEACSATWGNVPLSVAGWVFRQAECVPDGGLRFAYRKPVGGTLADFAQRVAQVYQGRSAAFFNLPADGEAGGFSLPVELPTGRDERELPDADEQLRRVMSFAQQMRLKLAVAEEDNRTVTPTGEESVLPWRVFNLTLETGVPPPLLLAELDDRGLRLNKITVSLEQGRLAYTLEGKLYGKP